MLRGEEICVSFHQCLTDPKARRCEQDRVHMVVNGHAIFRPLEPAIHLNCSRICWRWNYKCSADEGYRGRIGEGSLMVVAAGVQGQLRAVETTTGILLV